MRSFRVKQYLLCTPCLGSQQKMPKNKKKWIDNKTAETIPFAEIGRRGATNVEEGTSENAQQPAKKKNMEELEKYGIYYDDDYDYMQHLRTVNELNVLGVEERTIVRAPKAITNQTSTFLETGGKEVNMEQEAEPSDLPKLDEEVVAALEGDVDYLDELEDDFVARLNGGELPSNQPPEPANAMPAIPRPRMDSMGEMDSEDGYPSSNDSMDEYESDDDDGMGNARAGRAESGRIIDEQFERLYEEGSSEEEDEVEPDNMIEPDSSRMKQLVEESKNDAVNLVLSKDEVALRYAYSTESDGEADGSECVSVECPSKKRPKWDCESVLSSYSNIYNHPTVIKERTAKKKKLKLGDEKIAEEQQGDAMELCSVVTSVQGTGKRRRDETVDEKRDRKRAVKEARAERRAEKKANKRAFAETRKTSSLAAAHPTLKHVHIA